MQSLLSVAWLPLLQLSVSAIQHAAPLAMSEAQQRKADLTSLGKKAEVVAPVLGLPVKQVEAAFDQVQPTIKKDQTHAFAVRVAPILHKPVDEVEKALTTTKDAPPPTTDLVERLKGAFDNLESKAGGNPEAVARLGILSLMIVAVYAAKYWFTRGQAFFLTKASIDLSNGLRSRMFSKLQRVPISYFGEQRVGEIQSVLTNDVGVYGNAISIIRDSIDGPIRAIISLIYVVYQQPLLALVTLLFVPGMSAIIKRNSKVLRRAQTKVQEDLAELNAMSTESLLGTRIIKAFGVEKRVEGQYETLIGRSTDSQLHFAYRFASLRPMVELLGAVAVATVVYACGWLSFKGLLDLGQVVTLVFGLDQINQGLRSITNVTGTYNQVQAASERIYRHVLNVPDQVEDDANALTLPNPVGRIEFEHVSFSYPDGTEALSDVSFVLEPGHSLALVGPSGAGKSTIADLVLRFYEPTSGRITFDGQDIRSLSLSWLRRQIGVVPQQTFLFAGTIADNIRMGNEEASIEAIRDAALAAHATEFIEPLPQGYEASVGEGGAGLSGGQRQRVAIARALVRKPALLLLDEATSALDATSEKAVTEALDQIMKVRTTLFIAHRLTTAARADRILMLVKGKVVEEGSHVDLMAANGSYAALFRAFSGGVLG